MINVGIIGCGYWGPNLIRNFRSIPGCRVKWICDLSQERLERMQQLYPESPVTQEIDQLLDDSEVNAVAIATPVSTHHEFAKKSLMAGKHTFIEKPMARSVAECEKLVTLAEESGLTLMVGHTFIYTSAVKKIKEIIQSGEIGEILYISSRRLNLGLFQKDINVAWDLAPHDLSIILDLLRENPVSVNCQGKAHVIPGVEDVTNLSMNFSSGAFALVHNSWLDPNKVRLMTVVGSKKMMVYDDLQPLEKIKLYDRRVENPRHYDTFGEFQYSYHYGSTYSPFIDQEEPLKLQSQHFLESIEKGSRPNTSGYEGLEVVRILEAASRSLANDGSQISL